ncbi:hypothetical protein PIB30_018911 [Stylosanthes scabra]|uniref:Uncharacterized protein n=1 Tax=Stylosanthes scabra TaxID=79078 RepID=A0ABU6X604_9FABA|nr:hypothetical protein [Stylosanthes scabra]
MEWDVKSFGDVFPLRANAYIRIPILGSQLSSTTNLVVIDAQKILNWNGIERLQDLVVKLPCTSCDPPHITWRLCLSWLFFIWFPRRTGGSNCPNYGKPRHLSRSFRARKSGLGQPTRRQQPAGRVSALTRDGSSH